MSAPELPEGFRIVRHVVGGSGRGDELFTFALQQWRTLAARRRFLRRREEPRPQWVTVEVGNPFGLEAEAYCDLVATARMLAAAEVDG